MIAPLEALQQAISTSSDATVLDDLARLIWRGLSEGEINEDDAQGLSKQIAARSTLSTRAAISGVTLRARSGADSGEA